MIDQSPSIRMVFELAREEHPRLYDDLIRFPKGTKRINRLRTLAHDGMLAQAGVNPPALLPGAPGQEDASSARNLTNQIFELPLSE